MADNNNAIKQAIANSLKTKAQNNARRDIIKKQFENDTKKAIEESRLTSGFASILGTRSHLNVAVPVSPRTMAAIEEMERATAARLANEARLSQNKKMTSTELSRRQSQRNRLAGLNANNHSVRVVDAGGAGNCFYLSVHAALFEAGLVERVEQCLGLAQSEGRDLFIGAIRNFIADNVADRAREIYDELQTVPRDSLAEIMSTTFSGWHRNAYNRSRNAAEFIQNIASGIRANGAWASEIEIILFRDALRQCGIEMVSHSNRPAQLSQVVNGMPAIHLYNPRDIHWQYFSFLTAGGDRRSKTRRSNCRRTLTRHNRK